MRTGLLAGLMCCLVLSSFAFAQDETQQTEQKAEQQERIELNQAQTKTMDKLQYQRDKAKAYNDIAREETARLEERKRQLEIKKALKDIDIVPELWALETHNETTVAVVKLGSRLLRLAPGQARYGYQVRENADGTWSIAKSGGRYQVLAGGSL